MIPPHIITEYRPTQKTVMLSYVESRMTFVRAPLDNSTPIEEVSPDTSVYSPSFYAHHSRLVIMCHIVNRGATRDRGA